MDDADREVLQSIAAAASQAVQAMYARRAEAGASPAGLPLVQSLQQQLKVLLEAHKDSLMNRVFLVLWRSLMTAPGTILRDAGFALRLVAGVPDLIIQQASKYQCMRKWTSSGASGNATQLYHVRPVMSMASAFIEYQCIPP